jgi:flavodoxin
LSRNKSVSYEATSIQNGKLLSRKARKVAQKIKIFGLYFTAKTRLLFLAYFASGSALLTILSIMKVTDKKRLIAYFSRNGQNYVSGKIVDLRVGNTEVVANMIQKITEGDLFPIEPVTAYPKDYTETTDVAKKELRTKARPKLTGRVENMKGYDVIFLGYPNWWGTMPMPVYTFLESYDLSGKTIVPFCTHEGSGLGHSEKDIATACPKAAVLAGIAIHGTNASSAGSEVSSWIERLDIL